MEFIYLASRIKWIIHDIFSCNVLSVYMYVYLFGMYNNSRKNYSDNFFSMISPKLFKVIQISLLIYMREIFFPH